MNGRIYRSAVGLIALAGIALLVPREALGQIGGKADKPRARAKVTLVSSVSAVVPGKVFDVAWRFQLDRGWHIYWQNGGDAGLPPKVQWTLPEGFTAGELQFPTPKRHVNAAGLTSYIHEGDPTLIVSIAPPATIAKSKVTLAGKVRYLICQKICVWGDAEQRLELPVAPSGSTPELINAELFERARSAQPNHRSDYVVITPALSTSELLPGTSFELLVNVEVAPGYRIHAHEPASGKVTNCDLFIERTPDIYFERAIFPKPTTRTDRKLGKVSEYSGKMVIRVPASVDAETPFATPPRLGGVFTYQACDDSGDCRPPEALAFSVTQGEKPAVPGAGVSVPAVGAGPSSDAAPSPTGGDAGQSTSGADAVRRSAGWSDINAGSDSPGDADPLRRFLEKLGLPGLLLGCFLYGLFINATPCVLPVLSVKVLGFVQQAHESRRRTLVLGLAFGAGVVLFFVILGLLAAQGRNVLQYPAVVVALGAIVMALALSMLGVYTLQAPTAAAKLEASIGREGVIASFGKGALAPVLGFACTGPLLAGAFGWATQQPSHIAVLAFVVAGLGMASPYVLLGANPSWLSFIPKPGPWMITFERIMGFLLLAMVVWLLHPLTAQIGVKGLELTLVFLVAIGMACWILGMVDATMTGLTRWRYRGGAASLVVASGVLIYGWGYAPPSYEVPW
ncbi:MAG: protein-disulfide reductase DsbD domain-containing protein [Phycisphaerae bacterium]